MTNTASATKQIVITGYGVISTCGDATADLPDLPLQQANGVILDFKLETYLQSQKTYLDRCSSLALAACALALKSADVELPFGEEEAHRFGIVLGTHLGCVETMKAFWDKAVERGVRVANPLLFSHSYYNTPISLCAIEFGLKGYHTTLCAGSRSGLEAIRAGYDAIRVGHADAVVCGGVEAYTPTRQMLEPDGNAGEAAAFFVLESAERAAGRGVKSTATVNDDLLNEAEAGTGQARTQFGHCGGAESALAFYRALLV